MNCFRIAVIFPVSMATMLACQKVRGQLPTSRAVGSASTQVQAQQRIQAQTQQRVEAQAQQRIQAQVQQQVQTQVQAQAQRMQAQTQARVQADATRAAHIAQQAAAAAQRQVGAARARLDGRAGLHANAAVQARARVANQSAGANASTRIGTHADLAFAPEITDADVRVYDNIFGRFNPLRSRSTLLRAEAPASAESASAQPIGAGHSGGQQAPSQDPIANRPRVQATVDGWSELDLATRISIAARERRAEISQLRDRALDTGDVKLLEHCNQMEAAMNAFVAAQARANIQGEAAMDNRPLGVSQSAQPAQAQATTAVSGSGSISSRTPPSRPAVGN